MNAKTLFAQHEWDSARTIKVVPLVSGIISNAKNGKLPEGFNLLGVLLSKGAPRACCVWQSESKESLERLPDSVNPRPGTDSELDTIYGITRA